MRLREWVVFGWLGLAAGIFCGCGGPAEQAAGTAQPAPPSADELLDRVRAAYAQADAYTDAGVVQVHFRQRGETVDSSAPFSVSWVRPGKLRVRAYQAELACDSQTLRGRITDENTRHLDGQFLERPAPETLTLTDLISDRVLYEQGLGSGDAKHPMSLELLLGEKPLAEFSQASHERRLLPEEKLEGQWCARLEVESATGPFVFWIDRESYLLRRVEYPTGALANSLRVGGPVSELTLVANFHGARFAAVGEANAFTLAVPENAKKVRYFVLPPAPLPSPLVGKPVGDFQFETATGEPVSRATLAGKVVVLAFFGNDPRHKPHLAAIDLVAKQFSKQAQVVFHGVCAEEGVTADQLRQLQQEWHIALPLALDSGRTGRAAMGVTQAPALVVLDGQATMHIFDLFDPLAIGEQLPAALERLLKGENLAAEILRQAELEQAAYAQQLAAAGAAQSSTVVAVPVVKVAERSEPRQLRLERRWMCREVTAPGNFLITQEASGGAKVFVLDGYRTVVELSASGAVVARHELPLPEKAAVSMLRTAVTGQGQRYFAAAGLLGPQAFVFDEHWKLVGAYPPAGEKHEGLRDFQLADLNGDGIVELYVGFWNLLGTHAASLEGQRLWANRATPTALGLAVSEPNEIGYRKLVVVGDRGQVLRINPFGHHDKPFEVPGRSLSSLVAARFTNRSTAYCGLAFQDDGRLAAVALNQELKEEWSFPLAVGAHENQIEAICSGHLLDNASGAWALAAPDGGVAIISDDGKFVDVFHYGELLSGMAMAELGQDNLLLVSAGKKVEAWKASMPKETGGETSEKK